LCGRDIMQERGRKFMGDDLISPYYDRQNKRQLYFDSLPPVKGLVSDKAFGRPVPFYNFVGPSQSRGVPYAVPCSEWMYYEREPEDSDIGSEAPMPTATDLPLHNQPISDPYDEDDEDDLGFGPVPVPQAMCMPPSPPTSEAMIPQDDIGDIETDFTPIIAAHPARSFSPPVTPPLPGIAILYSFYPLSINPGNQC